MTGRGKFILTLVILGVVGFGAWKWWDRLAPKAPAGQNAAAPAGSAPGMAATPSAAPSAPSAPAAPATPEPALAETQIEIPKLDAPGIYQPKDNTVEVELSEYAGYAGLIAANGGLEPNENSIFFRKHGFKVKLTLSEEESWSALNAGKIGASATTVDVLAVMGRQFQVVVPAQIAFSRGADGVVVRNDIRRINSLKGKILATAQFTEADFFIRYLAQEAGLAINNLPDLSAPPNPDQLNLVFCDDAFAAGDLFLSDLKSGGNRLAGCVTWAPKTTEVAQESGGKAHVLTTSANLLIVADILIVNKGLAQQNPKILAGLTEGLLEGNRLVRDNESAQLDTIAKAFKWTREQAKSELAKVHLSNLPENRAFFSGAIDAAGSYGGIYQSAVFAYGSDLIKDPIDGEKFLDLTALTALEQSGAFKDQKIAIAPIRSGNVSAVEGDPLLSKDIRFLFSPNSTNLDLNVQANLKNLEAVKKLLQVSPGSTVLLRGHVDSSMVEEFRKRGGDQFLRQQALRAVEFSRGRAGEIKRLVVERHKVDPARLDIVGRGWEEASNTDQEQNRRVEAQWFTLE